MGNKNGSIGGVSEQTTELLLQETGKAQEDSIGKNDKQI